MLWMITLGRLCQYEIIIGIYICKWEITSRANNINCAFIYLFLYPICSIIGYLRHGFKLLK